MRARARRAVPLCATLQPNARCGPFLRPIHLERFAVCLPRSDEPRNRRMQPPMIVILGGTNAHAMQRHGYLETQLAAASPDRSSPHFAIWPGRPIRSIANSGPVIFFSMDSHRPIEDPDHRGRIAADTIVLWMGQSEALDARSLRCIFRQAYAATGRAACGPIAHRLVLVTPVPFEDPLKIGASILQKRNDRLAQTCSDAIREASRERKTPRSG